MKTDTKVPTDPEILKRRLRFLILTLVSMSLVIQNNTLNFQFSNYFIFDQPALLKQEIIDQFTPLYGVEATNFYFSFLYSFYSIPNIILPFLGGLLSDRYGYRSMSVLFMIFVMIGQFILYMGSLDKNLKMMVFGRFLFGLGGESIGITANVVLIKWFAGKELSFANALNLSIIRSATVLNTLLSPKISHLRGMDYAFGFGVFLTIFSFGSLALLNYIDYIVERKSKHDQDVIDESEQAFDFAELLKQTKTDIGSFPKIFWVMTALMTTFYVSVLLFISFSETIITELWLSPTDTASQNEQIAGDLMGLPFMCCTFLSPFMGLIIDQKGQRIKIMGVGCLLVFIGLVSILFFYPIYTMLLLGIGYAMFGSTIWTTISFVVSRDKLGTAYGVMNSIQNFAFFLTPLFIAVVSSEGSQITVVLFFLIIACISLIFTVWLFKVDYQRDVSLDDSDQKALLEQLRLEVDQHILKSSDFTKNEDEEQLVEQD